MPRQGAGRKREVGATVARAFFRKCVWHSGIQRREIWDWQGGEGVVKRSQKKKAGKTGTRKQYGEKAMKKAMFGLAAVALCAAMTSVGAERAVWSFDNPMPVFGSDERGDGPMRTLWTMENRMPGPLGVEVGVGGMGAPLAGADIPDDGDSTVWGAGLGLRLGLLDDLALTATVPVRGWDIDGQGSKSGLGDVEVGAQFRFWEDIFDYAWIIPHASASFPTGDEDKMLGSGDVDGRVGLSAGTTVEDVWHFAADVSWILRDFEDDDDKDYGTVQGSLSLIYDLDEQASLVAEGSILDYALDPDESVTVSGHLGLAYDFSTGLSLLMFAGATTGSGEGMYGGGHLVYSF